MKPGVLAGPFYYYRSAHLEPVADITAAISDELMSIGRDVPVAVLPEGPMTVP